MSSRDISTWASPSLLSWPFKLQFIFRLRRGGNIATSVFCFAGQQLIRPPSFHIHFSVMRSVPRWLKGNLLQSTFKFTIRHGGHFENFISGMRACLACHIPDRWSRKTNWIWPDLVFGFGYKRSENKSSLTDVLYSQYFARIKPQFTWTDLFYFGQTSKLSRVKNSPSFARIFKIVHSRVHLDSQLAFIFPAKSQLAG